MDKVSLFINSVRVSQDLQGGSDMYAAYLINRSPSIAIEKKTPMEMWSGHPSDYGMLRIFGCVAYPHDKQVTSRNVVFNESVMYKDTLKDSGVGDKSVEELQQRKKILMNHYGYQDAVLCKIVLSGKAAIKEEMDSQRKNKTRELVDPPTGQKLTIVLLLVRQAEIGSTNLA
ncbi:hypothetical protein Tco_1429909 [Tanacetum coccineum]